MTNEITLIIECCKILQDFKLIEEKISQIKNWDDFITLAYSHGIFPLVYKTLKNYENHISSQILVNMKEIYMNLVKQNMLMTKELLDVVKLLEENDIETIAFKGPTLSYISYGDVISRQYVDLDILVNQKDLVKSVNLLLNHDYKNILPLEIISNNICLETIKDFALERTKTKTYIELHWNLFEKKHETTFKKLDILNSCDIFINDNKIKTLSNETLLVYLCFHGSKHMWERIEWIVDIDKLIRRHELNFSTIAEFYDDKSVLLGLYLCHYLYNTPLEKELLRKIEANKKIKKLSKKVLENMMDSKCQIDETYRDKKTFFFQLDLYDNLYEKSKYFMKKIFAISDEDTRNFYKIKHKSFFVFLRPYRLFKNLFK